MAITPWKVIGSRYVVRDPWMSLRADRCEMANGSVIDPYYVQEPPDWVHVVAFDSKDRILTVRQYRHGASRISTELPAGTVEPGETPVQAMQRELLEETCCTTESIQSLHRLSPNPARYSNWVHAFVATGARPIQEQRQEATEEIEFEFLTISEVLALIDTGAFSQALHVASLFLALRNRRMIETRELR